jgi:hypothetical protein
MMQGKGTVGFFIPLFPIGMNTPICMSFFCEVLLELPFFERVRDGIADSQVSFSSTETVKKSWRYKKIKEEQVCESSHRPTRERKDSCPRQLTS